LLQAAASYSSEAPKVGAALSGNSPDSSPQGVSYTEAIGPAATPII